MKIYTWEVWFATEELLLHGLSNEQRRVIGVANIYLCELMCFAVTGRRFNKSAFYIKDRKIYMDEDVSDTRFKSMRFGEVISFLFVTKLLWSYMNDEELMHLILSHDFAPKTKPGTHIDFYKVNKSTLDWLRFMYAAYNKVNPDTTRIMVWGNNRFYYNEDIEDILLEELHILEDAPPGAHLVDVKDEQLIIV